MSRRSVKNQTRRAWLAAPALAVTAVSAVLTIAVVVSWLQGLMPVGLALVVGAGYDGAWLAGLAYERRLAAQGDHDRRVTALGWVFGAVAAGMLVAHALTAGAGTAGWLAVSWLPLGAKALWWLHGLWEQSAVSPAARERISQMMQGSRDQAALARATLKAQARTEEIRLRSLAESGALVARVQSRASRVLSRAWMELDDVRSDADQDRALTSVTMPVTPASQLWELPAWTPVEALRPESAGALPDAPSAGEPLDDIVRALVGETDPPRSYRAMAAEFRRRGHQAGEVALRAAWRRVTGSVEGTA